MFDENRRIFLKGSAAAVLAASQVGRADSPNERVRVGVVGLGGRSRSHVKALQDLEPEGVELAALCDCDANKLAATAAGVSKVSGRKVAVYDDMRKLLDDKTIDAVTFATPNHWHSLGVIWRMTGTRFMATSPHLPDQRPKGDNGSCRHNQ